MSEHTPGPWIIQRGPHSDGHFEVGSDDGGGFFTVARVKGFSVHDAKANANLVAAAPSLLAALKESVDVLCMVPTDGRCVFDVQRQIRENLSVIAKAEGDS